MILNAQIAGFVVMFLKIEEQEFSVSTKLLNFEDGHIIMGH